MVGVQTLGFTVSGFISDGTDVVDLDLSVTFVQGAHTVTVAGVIEFGEVDLLTEGEPSSFTSMGNSLRRSPSMVRASPF